jgi:HSP20 family protein
MKAKQAKEKTQIQETNVPVKQTETGITRSEKPEFTGPFTMMRHFAEDLENMFADFGFGRGFPNQPRMSLFEKENFGDRLDNLWKTPFGLDRTDFFNDFTPPVEILKSNGNIIVRADLPGLEKEDINVEVRDKLLTIEGERKNETEEKDEGFYRSERSYGSFFRQIPLPEGTKTDEAKATFKNGVLEVTLVAPEITSGGKRLEITDKAEKNKK